MSHANARTTVHGRLLIVGRYRAGWRQAQIAAAMEISRKCVRTWIDRWKAEGEAGLGPREDATLARLIVHSAARDQTTPYVLSGPR